ncbi:hypothetical protein HanPSC8_Chr16g0717451 [Helianthus annuus]|nr:hypothetical protein HanPSC8_Chr16g0717451 [Helianthus annuus]
MLDKDEFWSINTHKGPSSSFTNHTSKTLPSLPPLFFIRQPSPHHYTPTFKLLASKPYIHKGARRSTTKLGAFGSRRTALVFFYPPLFYT